MSWIRVLAGLAVCCGAAFASDELTVYELLAPSTHSFAIIYDMATTQQGSPYLFNPIRKGSIASDERVIDAATGKPLEFSVVTAEEATKNGLRGRPNSDKYIQVKLARPVPNNGEARVRIYKTYTDPASYAPEDGGLSFQRGFGIKRNVIVLPAHYELISCGAPAIVSTQPDGRIRLSFFNDRDDELMVRLKARLLP
ncbi:MAG TPA: hypothetical protein VH302_12815 [Bryobacteraceae bacterium]|jgi:hypothetical protein|nr:hypothetical protein [Bryobacteraceae bacterium]